LANDNIKNHRFLNAFKYLCIIKGSLYHKDSTEIDLKKKIDSTIKVVEKQLNEITSKSQTVPLTTEETKSVTVNEESLDTLNQMP
jgi:hypothetical protein